MVSCRDLLCGHQPGYARLDMEEHELQTSGLFVPAATLVIHRLQFFHLRAVKSSIVNT